MATIEASTLSAPDVLRWNAKVVRADVPSPFTGHRQTFVHPGRWWELELVIGPLPAADAAAWQAALIRLAAGDSLSLGPLCWTAGGGPDYGRIRRGTATAATCASNTPVRPAGELWMSAVTPNEAAAFAVGDMLGVGGGVHMVLAAPTWDAGISRWRVPVFPGLASALSAGVSVELANPKGLWSLPRGAVGMVDNLWRACDGFAVPLVEAF